MTNLILKNNSRIIAVFPKRTIERSLAAATRFEALCAALNAYATVERLGRDDLSYDALQNADLVLAIGGDGTTLDVARYLSNTPLLSLRLKNDSVGFLCDDDAENASRIAKNLFNGTAKIEFRPRIQLLVNGEPQGAPAYNDLLIANANPARAARYRFEHSNVSEAHCSSGMWVATAVGSHAAARAAGATPLPQNDLRFLLRIRELAYANVTVPTIELAFSPANSPKIIVADAHTDVFGDGALWQYHAPQESVITFEAATPLSVVHV